MTTIRKTYTPAFKAEVAQEVLKGEKTITQISSQYGVHPNIIGKWKRVASIMKVAFISRWITGPRPKYISK